MKGSHYLSELIDLSTMKVNALNMVKAPTGSGKSYFALHYIPEQCSNAFHEAVYLIDTINGKEQILKNYNAVPYNYKWASEVMDDGQWFCEDSQMVIMTYAKFGSLSIRYPDFENGFKYIICDELHNLPRFALIGERPNYHTIAKSAIERVVKNESTTVIALTATPNRVKKSFHVEYNEIPIDQEQLRQYSVDEVQYFTDIGKVLEHESRDCIGLCYAVQIGPMKDIEQKAKELGYHPICIWSVTNAKHPMTPEQLQARDSILNDYIIPEQYNLLIINASCETSIKIKSHVDYAIINSSDTDTQIQVRGRVNSDLECVYLPANKDNAVITVPEKFLGVKLFQAEKRKLCDELNIRDSRNNRRCGWTSIHRLLQDQDYIITEGREDNLRYSIITVPSQNCMVPL